MKLSHCFRLYPKLGSYGKVLRICKENSITYHGVEVDNIESDDLTVLKSIARELSSKASRIEKRAKKEKASKLEREKDNRKYIRNKVGTDSYEDFVKWCIENNIDIIDIICNCTNKRDIKKIIDKYLNKINSDKKIDSQPKFDARKWLIDNPDKAEYDTLSKFLKANKIRLAEIESEKQLIELLKVYRLEYEKPLYIENKTDSDKHRTHNGRISVLSKGVSKEDFSASYWLSQHPEKAEYNSLMKFLRYKKIKINRIKSEEELECLLSEYYTKYDISVDNNGKVIAKEII